jgi:hypothetical protein
LENSFDEFETELKSFFPDQEGSATTVTHEPFSHLQSSEVEERCYQHAAFHSWLPVKPG